MKWNIEYSRDADRFIDKQDIRAEVREQLDRLGISFFEQRSCVV